ncbi:hypothetical protein T265_12019 [Opisthorchis viverrini]|uniref:Uncharacterized protein n=1 Tax=Opisthorchis viverrini TaxID=6198 RepID=A0A074YWM5_OPIVI|nr:hypothetical protein T265_12019 [Opisthorchis viverrini]KER19083.1 hypothetical protein T265_12019 [Opisthorchis viverrini]
MGNFKRIDNGRRMKDDISPHEYLLSKTAGQLPADNTLHEKNNRQIGFATIATEEDRSFGRGSIRS